MRQAAQALGPQKVLQADNILRATDGLLARTDFVCSPSVHYSLDIAGHEKEYSDKLRLAETTLSAAALKLRAAINRTCPINKLPPEILTRCFLHFTPDFPPSLGPSVSQHDCILISHVCRYWRAVACGFAGLWNRIEFTRPEILSLYLSLAGSRPLDICLQHVGRRFRQSPESFNFKMLNLLTPLEPRIRSLFIHKQWIPFRHFNLCPFIERPLPELETLAITSDVGWENESEYEPQKRLRTLFRGELPRLRELLIPEYTPWPNNDFKNLSFLCLYNQSAVELELPELLQMLRGSPNLEELYLRQHEHSEWIEQPPQNPGPTFPAHSLRKLRLHNFSIVAMACILSTMRLQPNGVAVNISDTVVDVGAFAQMFPLLPPESALNKAEKLEVYYEPDVTIGLMFCCAGGSMRFGGSPSESRREVAVSSFRFIYQECAQSLKELYIHGSNDKEEGYIFDGFTCFNLEKLVVVVGGDVSNRLCEVLDPRNSEIETLPAPRLRSLAIRKLYDQRQLECLVALCEARFRTKHPLQEVSVEWIRKGTDVPEWMRRLCTLSPIPIGIDTSGSWDGQMMKLPSELCTEDGEIWWPSWEGMIDTSWEYNC